MPEYIEREKALNDFDEWIDTTGALPKGTSYYHECRACIEDVPAADVVEVVHASWVWGKVCGSKGYCCTNCGAGFVGENAEWIAKEHDYCPKCGAKMDGDKNG